MDCRCSRMLKSVNYVVSGNVFYIITNSTNITLQNRMTFSLILCQNIPVQTEVLPVSIQVNGENYPLLDAFGNRVLITDLRTRYRYALVYGAESPHFLAFNICSNLNNVNINIATVVAADSAPVDTENGSCNNKNNKCEQSNNNPATKPNK